MYAVVNESDGMLKQTVEWKGRAKLTKLQQWTDTPKIVISNDHGFCREHGKKANSWAKFCERDHCTTKPTFKRGSKVSFHDRARLKCNVWMQRDWTSANHKFCRIVFTTKAQLRIRWQPFRWRDSCELTFAEQLTWQWLVQLIFYYHIE